MPHQKEILLNTFQLNRLLSEKEKGDYEYLLHHGVNCNTCDENCSQGVQVKEIYLNSLNDIKIQGTCNKCGGKVTRIMEFGEDKAFFEKTNKFRKSLNN